MIKKAVFLIFVCTLLYSSVDTSFAQVLEKDDVFVEVNPEIPEAGQLVKMHLKSYLINVDELYTEWIENKEIKLSGYGEKDFQFITGAIGEAKLVTLNIKRSPEGEVIYTKQFVSKPSGLDILWQAIDSYTPPFYKGKALPTSESTVKIIALPNFQIGTQSVLPKNAIYAWKRDYKNIGAASGYGKNVISVKKSYLKDDESIQITATEPKEGSVAKGTLLLKTYKPKIVFYKKDPLYGINFFNGIVKETMLGKNDLTLMAAPYFVSPKNILDPDLSYTWSLNGSEITTPLIKNQIVLRGTDELGAATLDLLIESAAKLFLTVKKSIDLNLQTHE